MAHSPNGSFAKWYIRQMVHSPNSTQAVYIMNPTGITFFVPL
jgi:hypothetical protein